MSKADIYINHTLNFSQGKVMIDAETVFEQSAEENYVALTKRIFKSFPLAYPKFHKMDRISKLAFISGELLLNKAKLTIENPENVAVILSNSSATIETDTKFQKSISQIPSPAIFVYTLPNIMIGELCIRHGFKGESMFFVEPQFNANLLVDQTELLFSISDTEIGIIGWVDFYSTEKYNCYMSIVSKEKKGRFLSKENLISHFKI